jgi:hypothetical protein
MRAPRLPALAVVLAFGVLARESAATITINLSAETRLSAQGVSLTIDVANAGDEAAHDVTPDVTWNGEVTHGDAVGALDSGAHHQWTLSLGAPGGAGTFPMVIRIGYADANGYPLSALLVHLLRTPGSPAGPVRPTLSAGTMARYSNARLVLENPGPRVLAGRVVPALPAEFKTDPETVPAQVPAQGRTEVRFVVQNNGALPGSVYPIYAIFEYDLDGTHEAVVGDTTVRVVVETADRWSRYAIIGAVFLVVIALFGFALQRAARRPTAAT